MKIARRFWTARAAMVVLLASAALSPAVVAPTPAAGLGAYAVCEWFGSVHLTNGYHANPANYPSSGSLYFNSTFLVCSGAIIGSAAVNASGSYTDPSPYVASVTTSAFT